MIRENRADLRGRDNGRGLLVYGFIALANQSRINIIRSTALRDIAGHISKGAGFIARRAAIRNGFIIKNVTTLATAPLRHDYHLHR
jgi:hypothetical protein